MKVYELTSDPRTRIYTRDDVVIAWDGDRVDAPDEAWTYLGTSDELNAAYREARTNFNPRDEDKYQRLLAAGVREVVANQASR